MLPDTRGDEARRAVEGLRLSSRGPFPFPNSMEGRMAARTEVRGPAAAPDAAIDVRELPRRRRLQRALVQPEVLEEFLVDPEGVSQCQALGGPR